MSNINSIDCDTEWNVPTVTISHEESLRLRIQSITNEELERQLQKCKADGHAYFKRPAAANTPPKQPFNWRAFAIGAMVVEVFVLVLLKVAN